MARKRYLITNIERYLNSEEADLLINILKTKKINVRPHIITSSTYAIEVKQEERAKIRNDIGIQLQELNCTIYKTNDTIKALRERQKAREDIEALNNAINDLEEAKTTI